MYHPRLADKELTSRLASTGAVVVEGPKACGKTALARQIARSEVLLDVDENARRAIAVDPMLVLAGAVPRLIDEWQIEPAIWNHIRRTVDDRGSPGQFVLTGSAVPADDITRHTGAGRISRLRLRTMSLLEAGHSTGEISLQDMLGNRFSGCSDPGLSVGDVTEQLCRGGWPGNLELSHSAALSAQIDYLDEIQRVDIARVDGVQRNPRNVSRVIRSLARNLATPVTARTIAADAGGADGPLHDDTVRDYLAALQGLMIYEEQPAWSPQLRSRSTLRKSPKRHFVDPSLAVAALGATPDRLLKDLNSLGLLFESMVYRELSIYSRACDASVYHYRDNTGLEVDAIVENRQGDWCAFAVKLGAGQVDDAASVLLKFRERVDLKKSGLPRMLGVIVSSGYGYLREDGIAVIPIGALGP
jgi:predicted AAA+ superfamily ATPase